MRMVECGVCTKLCYLLSEKIFSIQKTSYLPIRMFNSIYGHVFDHLVVPPFAVVCFTLLRYFD